jgi:hypothetical protein
MARIALHTTEKRVRTNGLATLGQSELQVEVASDDLVPDAERLLNFVVNYLRDSDRHILNGETFAYGYWLLKFIKDKGVLEAWEYNSTATDFIRGGSLTLTYWRDQQRICQRFGGDFQPPIADRLTVIDEGVLAGWPVEGVRYPSPSHMSGWWITSNKYNGNIETLRKEHTYHITAARPDLAQYLALPFGFRFSLNEKHVDVWFDQKVASEPVDASEA